MGPFVTCHGVFIRPEAKAGGSDCWSEPAPIRILFGMALVFLGSVCTVPLCVPFTACASADEVTLRFH